MEQFVVVYYFDDGDVRRFVLDSNSMDTALVDAGKFITMKKWDGVIGVKVDPLNYPTFG